MNPPDLRALYGATQQDVRFGIGTEHGQDGRIRPLLLVGCAAWTLQLLELVAESIHREGLTLVWSPAPDGRFELHLATRETMVLQASAGQDSAVLRAPAWDAHLAGIVPAARERFEASRRHCGGFRLLLESAEAEWTGWITSVGQVDRRGDPSSPCV